MGAPERILVSGLDAGLVASENKSIQEKVLRSFPYNCWLCGKFPSGCSARPARDFSVRLFSGKKFHPQRNPEMKKSLVLASLIAVAALAACSKTEAPAPAPAPAAAPAAPAASEAASAAAPAASEAAPAASAAASK